MVDRPAGLALLPYAVWVTFATALTADLARQATTPGARSALRDDLRTSTGTAT
ncbi:MAG: tryptophan-rich sensory protein [Actinomycetota bacterium]|nr:tryptophan-rich sensory protein [Actinomycetota bacterium]